MLRALGGSGASRDPGGAASGWGARQENGGENVAPARATAPGSSQREGVPEGTPVSPEQEWCGGLPAESRPSAQEWHWGFSSTFAPSLVEVGHMAGRGASCFRERCSVTGYPTA